MKITKLNKYDVSQFKFYKSKNTGRILACYKYDVTFQTISIPISGKFGGGLDPYQQWSLENFVELKEIEHEYINAFYENISQLPDEIKVLLDTIISVVDELERLIRCENVHVYNGLFSSNINNNFVFYLSERLNRFVITKKFDKSQFVTSGNTATIKTLAFKYLHNIYEFESLIRPIC